jgi:RsiW-degrading membrane proteinase PrsW (M82 family)
MTWLEILLIYFLIGTTMSFLVICLHSKVGVQKEMLALIFWPIALLVGVRTILREEKSKRQ